jgi:hypothetical protein
VGDTLTLEWTEPDGQEVYVGEVIEDIYGGEYFTGLRARR